MEKQKSYGVVVGRFQCHRLHSGHRYLIDLVREKHENIIIIIGVHSSQPTCRNPLSFEVRRLMVQGAYPEAIIVPVQDNPRSDAAWSASIDDAISAAAGQQGACLYGSRDSFITCYSGVYPVKELPTLTDESATALRKECAQLPLAGIEFRQGIIYGIHSRFPSPYLAVDIALMRNSNTEVLLGKKLHEEKFRFIGGFVDSADASITAAAKRELREETGGNIEAADFTLIGESRIDDHRYRKDEENIFSNLFIAAYCWGPVKASDDMAELDWVPVSQLAGDEVMIKEHHGLRDILLDYLTKQPK